MYSLNAICKATGKRWRKGGKFKSDAPSFLSQLIVQLNNTTVPSGRVETLTTDHGGKVISKVFQDWLKHWGIFHMTIPREFSALVENMAFAMLHHTKKPKAWWDYAFRVIFLLEWMRGDEHSGSSLAESESILWRDLLCFVNNLWSMPCGKVLDCELASSLILF